MVGMANIGDRLVEDRRQRRRAGDPRLSPEGREALLRLVKGDLADEFAASLAEVSDADPLLSGDDADGDDPA
jgi:hypothetical protein